MSETEYAVERQGLSDRSFLWLLEEKRLLAMVARGQPIDEILTSACLSVEAMLPNSRCSFLILDETRTHFIGGVAPSFPTAYLSALEGVAIGPQVGSCGTACWRREAVSVDDVRTHELWASYRDLAARFDLRASSSIPVFGPDGTVLGCYAVYSDHPSELPGFDMEALTACSQALGVAIQASVNERSLALRESRFRLMVGALSEGVMLRSASGKLLYANQNAARILGTPVDKLLSSQFSSNKVTFLDADGRAMLPEEWPSNRALATNQPIRDQVMGILRHFDHSVIWVQVSCQPLPSETPKGEMTVMISLDDITEVRNAEHRIAFLASHDSLTNLLNRVAFEDLLTKALARVTAEKSCFALLYIDLDRFKTINDSLGHHRGDEVLCLVAERLVAALGERGCVARWGGDEFVAMVEPCEDRETLAAIATELIARVSDSARIDAYEMSPGASIGIALAPADGADASTLLRHADAAMYEAKAHGRGSYSFFNAALSERLERRTRLERALHGAVERDELQLLYQPILDVKTLRLVGVEALIRWNSVELGAVMPAEFIPVAEESEQIVLVGMWTLRTALRQAAVWQASHPTLRMSINLSAKQFLWPGLLDYVQTQLEVTGARPEAIDFELTETLLLNESTALEDAFTRLREFGIGLSIDDFGTGYSSLAYLMRFPIGTLKIDRSFIQQVPQAGESVAIAEAIIAMARAIGMRTVAEGVETQAQLEFLRGAGCDQFQGYLIDRPVTAKEIELRLDLLGTQPTQQAKGEPIRGSLTSFINP